MPFTPFHYSKNWTDPADFPTHQSSEEQNRADMQRAYTEWETYWNNVFLPELQSAIVSGGSASGDSDDGGPYLALSGGILRGVLRLFRNPQLSDEAATKAYVDSAAQNVVTDSAGDISALQQRADEIEALVQGNAGDIASLSVRADEIEASVESATGEEAFLRLLSNNIALNVSAPATDGEQVFSQIELRVGPNTLYGQILLSGNVDVSGELSADALYALKGEVADLAVDKFTTSRRVVKYLAHDTSDDNFIRAQGQTLEFVTATTTGTTTQARNPNGELLYWPVNVSGLTLGADGYPRQNGERIFTTTTVTEYPVTVYVYTEAVKRAVKFELDSASGIYNVYDIFGAGNAAGLNRASVVKTPDAFDMIYVTSSNKAIGVRMNNDGYVDIDGLRKTTALDFSHFHEGYFTELVQGAAQPKRYGVTFTNGVPTAITDEGGNVTQITW